MDLLKIIIKIVSGLGLLSFLSLSLSAQNLFKDPNEATTQKIFADPNKKTTDTSQAVYDEGGESLFNRMTAAEKAIDFLKKEVASLKSEIVGLQSQLDGLNTKNNSPSAQPTSSTIYYEPSDTKPKTKPTPY